MIDALDRAYAIIGVPRGAHTHDVRQQYKRLVRIWHPDRWMNDPIAHAEATSRLRLINDAYATLDRRPTGAQGEASQSARRLTRDEVNAIVEAITRYS